ncbi:MAG: thioredoxin family protein [Pseudobacter sp.]|uniref:thioredoxin family protein n=1 Tax=Pseudobacter sp. TaxID=2045420 RepID=UPI003F7DEEC3
MEYKKHPFLKIFLFALSLFFYGTSSAQEEGIHFEHGLTWKEVKEKAKRENKFIFMDCYTTWCGPCKVMSKNIFPQKVTGDFFNDRFVSVKVQFDQTAQDNEEVKKWYADAEAIGKEYNVMAYPTFLYFSPEGELVHLFVGSTNTAQEFIDASAKSLDTSSQYYRKVKTMLASANGDPEVLRELVMNAREQYDGVNSARLADMYLRTQKNLLTRENLTLLNEFNKKSDDYGFDVFTDQTAKVNELMGKAFAEKKFVNIIFQETGAMDWLGKRDEAGFKEVEKKIRAKYPAHADMLIAKLKLVSYQASRDPDTYIKNISPFIAKYGSAVYPEELAGTANYIANFAKDQNSLKLALSFAKQAFKEKSVADHLFVQAVILNKMKKQKEAIAIQKQAIALAEKEGNKFQIEKYHDYLTKLEKGE